MIKHNKLAEICKESYSHVTFNIGECEAIIKYYDNYQVVAFRGTESGSLFEGSGWIDVIRDIRIIPWYDKDTGWCHSGFLKGGRRAAEFLADKLDRGLPVIFTGHSLGGALALMCAAKLHSKGFFIEEWVGFGSPKTQFSKKTFSFRQTNYRHGLDVVPLMPRIWGYRHNYRLTSIGGSDNESANWEDHDIDKYVSTV